MFIVMHDRDQKHVVMVDERSIVLQLCCHHGADIEVLSLAWLLLKRVPCVCYQKGNRIPWYHSLFDKMQVDMSIIEKRMVSCKHYSLFDNAHRTGFSSSIQARESTTTTYFIAAAKQKVDLVTRLDVIKSAIMSKTRHGSSKVAQF